jgi:hypothetical protein
LILQVPNRDIPVRNFPVIFLMPKSVAAFPGRSYRRLANQTIRLPAISESSP